MFEEIQLSPLAVKEIAMHSNITLTGAQVEEHFKCTDASLTQKIDNLVYVVKVTNGQTVQIHTYNIQDLFQKQIVLSSEYLYFSHLITQNGCVLANDDGVPYLLVVAQTGQIFYKNLLTNQSNIIKNMMTENQRFVCLAKQLKNNDQLKFYALSDTDMLHQVMIDVRRGELVKNKYHLSFGTKFFSKFFGQQTNDWKTAFQINNKQIIHYSFQTQLNLLELRDTEFVARQLHIEDNLKVKQIEVFQHKPNGQITLCYLQQNQLKIYYLIGNNLTLNYTINNLSFLQTINFQICSTQNAIILIQNSEIYYLSKDTDGTLEQLCSTKNPVLGHTCEDDTLLLFYKNQMTYVSQIQDRVSQRQYFLKKEIVKFKRDVENQFKLRDEEMIIQSITIDSFDGSQIDLFQKLVKFMHRNLDQKIVLKIMRRQNNNFRIQQFLSELMDELENSYVFLKNTFRKLNLNFQEIHNVLSQQLENVNSILSFIFQDYNLKEQEFSLPEEWIKLQVLKQLAINQLKDYYQMYLEIYLAIAILHDVYDKNLVFDNDHKMFYDVMLLLSLFQDKQNVQFQDVLKKKFKFVQNDIQLIDLNKMQSSVYKFINLVYIQTFRDFAIPDEYLCESFIRNQIKSLVASNDAKEIIRHCTIAQQSEQIPTNAVHFIIQNEDQFQELKLKVSFYLQKQNPKQYEEQKVILKCLINYAIKQQQYQLLFQLLNLNDTKSINDQLVQMIENEELFQCQLNARTTDQIGQLLLDYSRANYGKLDKVEKIMQFFNFLIKMESRAKAYTLMFEYVVNLEMLLFSLKPKKIPKFVRVQLDCLNLLINQMLLKSRTDTLPYSLQLICKISEQTYRQFLNPSTINDKSEIDERSIQNIRIINYEQIQKFKLYKEIQFFVCQNYSPYAQVNKIIEQLIFQDQLDKMIQLLELNIDQNIERDVAFYYFCNEKSRTHLLERVKQLLSKKEFSSLLAQICIVCNLNIEKVKELYRRAPIPEYFLQYLIHVEKEQMIQMII